MIHAIVISNGIEGLPHLYRDNEQVRYHFEEVTAHFNPDLSPYDLLVVPNGTDHVAMMKIKDKVADFLAAGKTLFCFCGWFTSWVPNHQWVMNNSKKTIDVRYKVRADSHHLFDGIDIAELNFSHGISGWWACGYIKADPRAEVLIEDTWGRPLMIVDDATTPGLMVLTASGPLADFSYGERKAGESEHIISRLYKRLLNIVTEKISVAS